MIVLHYICKSKKATSGVAGTANCDAPANKDSWTAPIVGEPPQDIAVDYAYSPKELRFRLRNSRPTVVNIHGCWSIAAWRAVRQCVKQRIPYILSTHRQLEPWHIADRYWLRKLPMLVLFQKTMVSKAAAILTSTSQEQDNILALSPFRGLKRRKPLNDNVVAITAASRDAAAEERALYRKVNDTFPFSSMDSNELTAENILLRIGLSQDTLSRSLTDDEYKTVKNINDETWRHVCIHACNEGIIGEIRAGADILRVSKAEINITDIERFSFTTQKNVRPLKKDTSHLMPLHLEEVADEEKATANDLLVMTMLLNLRFEIVKNTVSKRHIADIYSCLRFTDYDEEKVKRMLKRLHTLTFARRILTILHETLNLQDGFMPFQPLDDRGTTRLKRVLYMNNIVAKA